MFPFARMIVYGNNIIPPNSDFIMTGNGGLKDLAHPSRTVSQFGTVVTSTTQHLPGIASSFNFAVGGSNRYIVLNVADMTDLNVSKPTGDYTIEFYAYVVGAGGDYWYLSCGSGVAGTTKIYQGTLYVQNNAGGGASLAATAIPIGAWVHMALVQSGTSIYWYMNGTRRISTTGRWNVPNTPLRIGGYEVISNTYMDQIRITNSALYTTATITPPAYPFPI